MARERNSKKMTIEDLLAGSLPTTPSLLNIEPSSDVRTSCQFIAQMVVGLEENGFNRAEAIKIAVGIVCGASSNGE